MIRHRRDVLAVLGKCLAETDTFRKSTRGSVAVEYGLIAALVVIAVILAIVQVRANLLGLPFPALIAAFAEALGG